MRVKLKDVPLGCFFIINDMLCYKDNPTIGSDTNFCIVSDTFMGRPKFWLNRGYIISSQKYIVTIVDERFIIQPNLF